MPRRNKADFQPAVPTWQDNPPAGATRKALDREENGGGPPGTPLDNRPAEEPGTETADLVRGDTALEVEDQDEASQAYAGPSGGAVGGTPAGLRSTGGNIHRGLAPGESHRGDSTIGADPEKE